MSSVKHELAVRLKALLQEECIDKIAEPAGKGCTKVDKIYLRRATSNDRLSLVIQFFDPIKKEGWSDETVGAKQDTPSDGWKLPSGEIGGGTFERLRGSIMVIANLTTTRESEEEADEVVQEVIARVKHILRTNKKRLAGFTDSYGESISDFIVAGDTQYDSGAGNSNTTRDLIRWVAITKTSNPKR